MKEKALYPAIIDKVLRQIFCEGIGTDSDDDYDELYDVETFKTDVMSYPWKEKFDTEDPEFLVNFNMALMVFCHEDAEEWNYYGLSGQVVIFSDLSRWAYETF